MLGDRSGVLEDPSLESWNVVNVSDDSCSIFLETKVLLGQVFHVDLTRRLLLNQLILKGLQSVYLSITLPCQQGAFRSVGLRDIRIGFLLAVEQGHLQKLP